MVHLHFSYLQITLLYRSSQVQVTGQNIQGLSSNNFYTLPPPLNRLQREKHTPNAWLIQK